MDKREEFKHYMLAGHGRAAKLLEGNEECFRDIVLYGCLNDISYDLQCEGSRGLFLYNLVNLYEDVDYFLNPAIEKFLSDETVYWHIVYQLCDFIENFAVDGIQSAKDAMEEKYTRLYGQLLSARKGMKGLNVRESYIYLAITIIQRGDFEQALRVFGDMGAYFLKRSRTSDMDLKCFFEWFWICAQDVYGKEFLQNQLDEKSKSSKELARFKRVMFTEEPEEEKPKEPIPTAEKIIELAENENAGAREYVRFRLAEESEQIKLANAVLNEADPQKKADLLSVFTSWINPFPLSPEPIVEYAKSDNEKLRDKALIALTHLKGDCVHDFALELLNKQFADSTALVILLHNYRDEDKAFLLDCLEKLPIDQDDTSGWHDVVSKILDSDSGAPDEAILFVYEKSRCSFCREYAFDEMMKRNLLTKEILSECLWDCKSYIREEAEKLQENS